MLKALKHLPKFPVLIELEKLEIQHPSRVLAIIRCEYSNGSKDRMPQVFPISLADLRAHFNHIERLRSFTTFWSNASQDEKLLFVTDYLQSYKRSIAHQAALNIANDKKTNIHDILSLLQKAS